MHLVKFVIQFVWANFRSVEVSLKKQQKIKQFSKNKLRCFLLVLGTMERYEVELRLK